LAGLVNAEKERNAARIDVEIGIVGVLRPEFRRRPCIGRE
jgi:hypothetical protein